MVAPSMSSEREFNLNLVLMCSSFIDATLHQWRYFFRHGSIGEGLPCFKPF